ncbi:MAG: nucleotidyltransferase [Saprospiraceae bacterium]|nr:nucleotidyltransferase [Saprospiraceae bacterium]
MSLKPTLLILAAGMGSRYGGLKQMDSFGPNGETIIDYSLYDAINAGYGKIVFIIRDTFKQAFMDRFEPMLNGRIQTEYVCQELTDLPEGFEYNFERTKPWGTAHAVWVGRHVIQEPFGVINADDFYGRQSFQQLAQFLNNDTTENYSLIGYKLDNTLSEHGHVNRGVCQVSPEGNLTGIEECVKIARDEAGISYPDAEGKPVFLAPDTLVSMNMWGFKPSFMDYTGEVFSDFLKERGSEEKSELYIPTVIDVLIKRGTLDVKMIETDANWFGVTYPEDKPMVSQQIDDLLKDGVYPINLWS